MPAEPFVGQIMPAGFGLTPRGWAPCNGALLAISTNTALFSLLGTAFGGDGMRTFALPDLRGRALLGSDLGNIARGQMAGTETVTMTSDQLPSHTHTLVASTNQGGGRFSSPAGNIYGVTSGGGGEMIFASASTKDVVLQTGANVTPVGSGGAHNNMQPFVVLNYMIALQGIFPSRQ